MNKEWSITDDFYVSYLWDIIPLPIPNTRVLQAREEHKQINKHLLAQRDLLKPKANEALQESLDQLQTEFKGRIIRTKDATALKEARENVFKSASETLHLPDSAGRDLVETFLLVATLVLAFRTFFFQPFKIPTGSMQPTLYGITASDLNKKTSDTLQGQAEQGIFVTDGNFFEPDDQGRIIQFNTGQNDARIQKVISPHEVKINTGEPIPRQPFNIKPIAPPSWGSKLIDKLRGYSYHSLKAEGDWTLRMIHPPKQVFPLISKQTFEFIDSQGKQITKNIWFPPVRAGEPFLSHTSPYIRKTTSKKGEYVFNLRVKTGDHLFVNRMTYNFRKPKRGDIAIFTISQDSIPSRSASAPIAETFYIKRLVCVGGDTVTLGHDRQLNVRNKGLFGDDQIRRIDSTYEGFSKLYSHRKVIVKNGDQHIFEAEQLPQDSIYSGHTPIGRLNYGNQISVNPGHYLMFGDNTVNSRDSREWGELPQENVIGHSSFVYWPPLSPRFGWSHR